MALIHVNGVPGPERDEAMRKIVEIVQAANPYGPASAQRQRDKATAACVAAGTDAYRAAIVELVLEGTLNMDDGARLMGMVEVIVHDLARRDPDHPILHPEGPPPCQPSS